MQQPSPTIVCIPPRQRHNSPLLLRFRRLGVGLLIFCLLAPLPVVAVSERVVVTDRPVVQQAYLKASAVQAENVFGQAVAIDGDTIVVGALYNNSNAVGVNSVDSGGVAIQSGAAYVFVRDGNQWRQEAYLKASNTGAYDFFGESVAISGDTIVISAIGESSNASDVGGDQTNNAAPNAGAVYVFVRHDTTWTQEAYLKASHAEAGDLFGSSVAIDGDILVVGATSEDSGTTGVNGDESANAAEQAGAAYVFVRNGTVWTQQAYLKASNTEAHDFFGDAVAVTADTIVVGAYGEDSSAAGINGDQTNNALTDAGAAYLFTRTGTVWTQQAYLKAHNPASYNVFGWAVDVTADTAVITSLRDDAVHFNNDGAAYVFVRNGTGVEETWSQQAYLKAANSEFDDRFGVTVALSGDRVVIGAYEEDSAATGVNGDASSNAAANAGAAYIFARNGATWAQQAYLKASNTEAGDRFGIAVALGRTTVVVGAHWESSAATGVNGDEANNAAPLAGAVYVFTSEPTIVQVGDCGGYTVYETNGAYHAAGWPGAILVGTAGNDTLYGTAGRDLLLGLAGNDLLRGGPGDDLLCGGDGVDWLQGLTGNDYLAGGPGNDVLNGGGGDYDQLHGDAGNDVLLDGDGLAAITGDSGNDLLTVALRNGWRDGAGQPRFTGLAAGYDNDIVTLVIRNPVRFWVALTGDEADDPPSPLEGDKDSLLLAGLIEPTAVISKFEKRLLIGADADYLTPDEEAGVVYLSEPVGAKAEAVRQVHRAFLPLINQ